MAFLKDILILACVCTLAIPVCNRLELVPYLPFNLVVSFWVFWNLFCWARNVRVAKATGLTYRLVPFYNYDFVLARLLRETLMKVAYKIIPYPKSTSWQTLAMPAWPLKLRYSPFAQLGTDTFLTVAPGGILLYTADAPVIDQILNEPESFPKPGFIYRPIAIYGQNVVSSEGEAWKYHRKLTRKAFTSRNNRLVWLETLLRSQSMLYNWVGQRKVSHVPRDVARLSLEIICSATFGKRLRWDSYLDGEEYEMQRLVEGHKMSFSESLRITADNTMSLVLPLQFPRWLASN